MSITISIQGSTVSFHLDGEDQQAVIARAAERYAEKLAEQEVLGSTVDRLIDSGKIRYVTVGESKAYRITEIEMRRFLACL